MHMYNVCPVAEQRTAGLSALESTFHAHCLEAAGHLLAMLVRRRSQTKRIFRWRKRAKTRWLAAATPPRFIAVPWFLSNETFES